MAANPNLVLTPIVDKNGKLTKVYRKRTTGAPSTALIPAPGVAASITPDEALRSGLERLHAGGFIRSTKEADLQFSLHNNMKVLAQHSPETVAQLVDHILASDPQVRSSWEWALMSQNIHRDEDFTGRMAGAYVRLRYWNRFAVQMTVNKMQRHHKEFSAETSTETVIFKAEELVNGHDTGDFANLRAASIYLGMRFLDGTSSDDLLEDVDRDTLEYIRDNIDAVERVSEEMAKRGTMDREFINQLITAPQALTEGNL